MEDTKNSFDYSRLIEEFEQLGRHDIELETLVIK